MEQLDGPRPRPRVGVVQGDLVAQHVGGDPRVALDEVEVLGRAAEARLRRVVRRLDDEGVPFPAPAGVAGPLPDAVVDVRPVVERDHAAEVAHLLEDRHVGRRLQELEVAVVARPHARRLEVQAAVAEGAVLGSVGRMLGRVGPPLGRPRGRGLGHRRNAPVGRIDDERGAVVEMTLDQPERVVVAGDDVEVLELRVPERLLD